MPLARLFRVFLLCSLPVVAGCQLFVDHADQEVYRLIERRQRDALGETQSAQIDRERVPRRVPGSAYDFVPNRADPAIPEAFATTAPAGDGSPTAGAAPRRSPEGSTPVAPLADSGRPTPDMQLKPLRPQSITDTPTTQPAAGAPTTRAAIAAADIHLDPLPAQASLGLSSRPLASQPAPLPERPLFTLSQALAYAFAHAREYQTAKEDLYLAALALSLERFLWTPQFVGNIGTQYANYGKVRDFDQAMAAVAQVGLEQRLPLGGTITARVVDDLMRDLTHHVTTGETGQAILEANIPLLRGAGLVAYESRFQAERNLIYAVRAFETFRRSFAVQIAGDFFSLQQLRQTMLNARQSTVAFRLLEARARAHFNAGRLLQLEVQRAETEVAAGENREVDTAEAYNTALDQFKIRLGMPTETPIDVPVEDMGEDVPSTQPIDDTSELEDALTMPSVSEQVATATGLKYRLDLMNDFDAIDDAARGVNIAENQLLPDLNASGSVVWNTDPNKLGSWKYEDDRVTWRAGLNLELPLNRYAERNRLRTALIQKRRAERAYDQARDLVILQVRRAMRRVAQQRTALLIQERNRDQALIRRRGARLRFEKGEVSNREVVDAENQLLDARNRLAASEARLRLAILEFRRDTGTLRVDDQGKWTRAVLVTSAPVATSQPSG